MPRTRKTSKEVLIQNIEKARTEAEAAKDRYEKASKELEELEKKLADMEKEEIVKAYQKSGKSYDELMEFLNGNAAEDGEDESYMYESGEEE